MSRTSVLWDRMGLWSVRHSFAAAFFASLLSLFVLVSAVDAAACAPEAKATPTVAVLDRHAPSAMDADHEPGDLGTPHVACAHGHCHHSGVTVPPAAGDMKSAMLDHAPLPPSLEQILGSRTPTGPKRPPRA